jgi:hypothetical protein
MGMMFATPVFDKMTRGDRPMITMSDEELARLKTENVERRERKDLASPGPWLTPKEAGGAHRAPAFTADGTELILDHEGCQVWPWVREEDMIFAYAARSDHVEDIIDRLICEIEAYKKERSAGAGGATS